MNNTQIAKTDFNPAADWNFRLSNAATTSDVADLFDELSAQVELAERPGLSYAELGSIARSQGFDELSQQLGKLEEKWMEIEA